MFDPITVPITNFFNEATNALMILAPIVGGVFFIFLSIKMNKADEEEAGDVKKIKKLRMTTIYATIAVALGPKIITLVFNAFR